MEGDLSKALLDSFQMGKTAMKAVQLMNKKTHCVQITFAGSGS